MVLHADEIPEDPNDIKEGDSEVVRLIKELLVTRACKGCASSSVTLKKGVEQMMKHYIPEVTSVENVDDSDTPEVKAAKEKAEKELRKDFEDEMAAAIADEMKKMKKRR